jgi:hypothetical protein
MDMDDYINSLIKDNENLKKEIATLKKELRSIDDLYQGYDPEWNVPDYDDDASKLGLK